MKLTLRLLLGVTLISCTTAQTLVPATASSPARPLPKTTLDQIARMTPLFDGKTLAGWIQAPPAPLTFSSSDITDFAGLAEKIAKKSTPAAAWISEQLDAPARTAFAAMTPANPNTKDVTAALVKTLNRFIGGPSLYNSPQFQVTKLRPATDALRRKNPQGQDLMRLNRLLIEDAFPAEISASPAASWIVKDGAMASTGGGRGVVYTEHDFTHYRLIFTMRHVSGKPDHQPCVLVFCSRPPEGERGLDALGGIQFQTPNGGHWDYRPGHNNAGTSFTRPVKTTFDNHEWHQVEILVNAKTGVARMAVAQPVGTHGIENLVFSEAAAGKTGPIAWQMHNAGLFDEFKDVRIEIDPQEERLITVE